MADREGGGRDVRKKLIGVYVPKTQDPGPPDQFSTTRALKVSVFPSPRVRNRICSRADKSL